MDLPEKLRQVDATMGIRATGEFTTPVVSPEVAAAGVKAVESAPIIPAATPVARAKETTPVGLPAPIPEREVKAKTDLLHRLNPFTGDLSREFYALRHETERRKAA